MGWRSMCRHPAVTEKKAFQIRRKMNTCRVRSSQRLISCPVQGQTLNIYEPLCSTQCSERIHAFAPALRSSTAPGKAPSHTGQAPSLQGSPPALQGPGPSGHRSGT